MKNENVVQNKSKSFAIRIVKLYQFLATTQNEYILSKQLLRSGTSIGANVKEAIRAQTKPDFHAKICIALKEASETEYWLELLFETNYINEKQFQSINADCTELLKLLVSIAKTTKESISNS